MSKKKKNLIKLSTILLSIGLFSGCVKDDLSMYYNLHCMKGIEVYTHIVGENEYEFGFMSGTNRIKRANEVNHLVYVNLKKGKDIIHHYGDEINESTLIVIVIPSPCTDEDLRFRNNSEIELNIKNLLLDI